jgi:NAD(P)-dependent dehydrogenase (short-subunit alcohol dehydrogenase family)
MNPVGEEGNMFSALFDQVPAKRAGDEEDIAGAIMYLVSRAGVSLRINFELRRLGILTYICRLTLMVFLSV